LDFDFNPFDEHMVATGAEDGAVKIWRIPEGGLKAEVNDPLVSMDAHGKKVNFVLFHPTASNVLATAGGDNLVKVWDIQSGSPRWESDALADTIQDLKWNYNGSLCAVPCKDKSFYMYDPRKSKSAVIAVQEENGSKPIKMCFLGDSDKFVTVGTKNGGRQFTIWDIKNLAAPLHVQDAGHGSGVMLPFYDDALSVLYLVGKGDSQIRFFEITDEAPFAHDIGSYGSSSSQKGACVLPKRANNVLACEVTAMMKLHSTEMVERIAMTIPRTDKHRFQEDIFPDAPCGQPACNAEEWFAGNNTKPILSSVNPASTSSTGPAATTTFVAKKSYAELERELATAHKLIAELERKLVCK
jgi:hypothetical protein